MQKIAAVLEINAHLFVRVVTLALAALITTPGHAAVDHGEVVTNQLHQLVYLCQIKRHDRAAFSDFTRCLVHRPSILEFWHHDRHRRLGVDCGL